MSATRRFLLVAFLAGVPALAVGGDDPKTEEAKKAEAAKLEEAKKLEAAKLEEARKAEAAARDAAQAVLQAQVQRQQLLAQQVVLQRGGLQVQPGFGGPAMGVHYYTPA